MYNVTFKNIDNIQVCAVEHKGPYINLGNTFESLEATAMSSPIMSGIPKFFGIFYDDPETIKTKKPESLISHACISATPSQAKAANLASKEISGGPYAVVRFIGPHAQLETVYQWLFDTWLPNSGKEIDDKPHFENYINDPKNTPQSQLITDIHLPIKQ